MDASLVNLKAYGLWLRAGNRRGNIHEEKEFWDRARQEIGQENVTRLTHGTRTQVTRHMAECGLKISGLSLVMI